MQCAGGLPKKPLTQTVRTRDNLSAPWEGKGTATKYPSNFNHFCIEFSPSMIIFLLLCVQYAFFSITFNERRTMMLELKTITPDGVPTALKLAHRYRLLNDPQAAESICLDILEVEPTHQEALITLLLALTDSFASGIEPAFTKAEQILLKFDDPFMQAYYAGVIYERRAKAHLKLDGPSARAMTETWMEKAMEAYERAIEADKDRQEAVIRWNSCARLVNDQQ